MHRVQLYHMEEKLKILKYLILVITLLLSELAMGQPKNENYVYKDYIKTAQISINNNIESIPVMRLNSRDYMILTFDDLSNSEDDYYYRIVHCDRDWVKSEINELDYIDGFNDEVLRVWEFSAVTEVEYTHFWLQFPNRDVRLKISGNYILYIYKKDGDEEIPLITKRFIVSENATNSIINEVRPASGVRYVQQFDISTVIPEYINNPMNDISIEVIQNGHWLTSINDIKPFSVSNGLLNFDPFGTVVFPGLAEFRNFDTRILAGGGRGVESVTLQYGKNIVYLYEDVNRSRTPYLFDFDFNGKYYVDTRNANRNTNAIQASRDEQSRAEFSFSRKLLDGEYTFLSKDIRADYAEIHFRLKSDELADDVYLYGDFTDWQIKPEFKMRYDYAEGKYKVMATLKQGFYDYMYVADTQDGPNFRSLEGSWNETENDYTVIIYYREFASRYDRVLAVNKFNSL